jgi:hypothetical protein
MPERHPSREVFPNRSSHRMVMLSVPPSSSASCNRVSQPWRADVMLRRTSEIRSSETCLVRPVAAEETGRAPSLVQAGHDRSGLLASDAARKDMGPAGASDLGTGENSCVKQLLRHGLIA